MASLNEVERELDRLESLDEVSEEDLDRFKQVLPTDPELARIVNRALPFPWGEVFEFVDRQDTPYWRTKPARDHPNQIRAQDEFADAARESRGVRGTVERDSQELGLAPFGPCRRPAYAPILAVVVALVVVLSAPILGGLAAASSTHGAIDGVTTADRSLKTTSAAPGDDVNVTDDDAPVEIDDGTFYVGQQLQRDANVSANEELELLHPDGTSSSLFANDDGVVTIDTTGLAEGEYTLQGEDGEDIVSFRLVQQQFKTFALTPSTVTNQGAGSEATLSVETNRRPTVHYLTATIDGEAVGSDTLQAMFGGAGTKVDGKTLRVEGTNSDQFTLDFTGVPEGTLNLTTKTPDTGVTASASLTIEEAAAGTATLATRTVSGTAGDLLAIPILLEETSTARLELGSEDINYHVTMTVSDVDGDGEVTVLWNTHLAGKTANATDAFSAAGPDTLQSVDRKTDQFQGHIAYESYSIALSVGDTETGLGLATVTDPNNVERSLTIMDAPGKVNSFQDARTRATESNNIAFGDWAIFRVETAGVHAYITDKESLLNNDEGVSFSIQQSSSGANEQSRSVDLSDADVRILTVPDEKTISIAMKTNRVDALEAGNQYAATFEIEASANPYVTERVELMRSFTVVTPTPETNATIVCGRNATPLIQEYNANVDAIPGLASGLVNDKTLHGIVTGEGGGDYTIVTGADKRVTSFSAGAPDDASLVVETDCETFRAIVDAQDVVDRFTQAYENGDVSVRGSGIFGSILVETIKLVIKLAKAIGLL